MNTEFALHAVRDPAAGTAYAAARARVRTSFATRLTEVLTRFGRELTTPAEEVVRWLFAVHEGGLAPSYVEDAPTRTRSPAAWYRW